ncbi:mitochondrial import receptor subunit TOM20 homolog [Uloborus diversus]|uniref:mitochondrial import receptor subunit TOM20 homolog n=1 Tax=Uloborus diversus TaxID=327109 RepID=UPI00240A8FAA|nr:mitochondrial import receptor subunit TOM20 homolog [Uloborus diversus]
MASKMMLKKLPNLKDYDSVQKFFIQEVQLGEELLSQGDLENGVEHLSTAVAVCGEPAHLVEILEQQLAPHVFAMLMQRLPVISRRIVSNMTARRMQEEDVE